MENPLSEKELRLMDAYWHAANYLSVGQIYLYDNPLLKEPLKKEHVKPRLLGLPGVAQVVPIGGSPRQLQVIADARALRAHDVTLEEIAEAIRASNVAGSGGVLAVGPEGPTITVPGLVRGPEDLESTLVRADPERPVRISDVAQVMPPAPRSWRPSTRPRSISSSDASMSSFSANGSPTCTDGRLAASASLNVALARTDAPPMPSRPVVDPNSTTRLPGPGAAARVRCRSSSRPMAMTLTSGLP